jgi:hypothetical protein
MAAFLQSSVRQIQIQIQAQVELVAGARRGSPRAPYKQFLVGPGPAHLVGSVLLLVRRAEPFNV